MNKPSYVAIYGETCAGKSTLGKHLGSLMGCPYISFGDLKRDNIAQGTETGLAIERLLHAKCPLPSELGYSVIKDAIRDGLNFISGYPISVDEFNTLATNASMLGGIMLEVDEATLVQRFGQRRQCPQCHFPGVEGDWCHVHQIPMTPREDVSVEELFSRRKLYRQRIQPFLESLQIKTLPQLVLNSSVLTKKGMIRQAELWIKQLIMP